MEEPIRITKTREGLFQEVNGRPIMIVFNSEPREIRTRRTKLKTASRSQRAAVAEEQTRVSQPLEFVNVSASARISENSRKIIRRHVMNDFQRRERDRNQVKDNEYKKINRLTLMPLGVVGPFHISGTIRFSGRAQIEWQRFGSLDPFAQFPVTMTPHMYDLASQYLALVGPVTCPKESYSELNHTEADWFDLAMRDAALFHVLIGGCAMYFGLLGGAQRPRERDLHIMEVVRLLVNRIKAADFGVSDSTIATVAFLANIQCIMGNYEQWSTHIDGLQRMIEMRGGQSRLNIYLQWKAHRSDVMGCAEFGSRPRFPSIDGSLGPNQPVIILPHSTKITHLEIISLNEHLSSDLIYAVKSIQHLTDSINHANRLDVPMDAISIQKIIAMTRRLLITASSKLDGVEASTTPQNNFRIENCIQEPLRLGALIYLKTLIPQPPFSQLPSPTMISLYRSVLTSAKHSIQNGSMLLWLAFIGGMFLTSRSDERSWFVDYAAEWSYFLGVVDWKGAKTLLMEFWWVKNVHNEEALRFWEEVKVVRAAYMER